MATQRAYIVRLPDEPTDALPADRLRDSFHGARRSSGRCTDCGARTHTGTDLCRVCTLALAGEGAPR